MAQRWHTKRYSKPEVRTIPAIIASGPGNFHVMSVGFRGVEARLMSFMVVAVGTNEEGIVLKFGILGGSASIWTCILHSTSFMYRGPEDKRTL
jgi:hypothetical protein